MSAPTRVSYALDADELREATIYAWYKHVGGSHPVAALAKECFFSYMRKYAIPEAQRAKLEAKYDETLVSLPAVQPEASEGERELPL